MPGGRLIHGRDLQAALRAAIPDDDVVGSYEELARAAPPARLGISSGAHSALFGPLFGEFE